MKGVNGVTEMALQASHSKANDMAFCHPATGMLQFTFEIHYSQSFIQKQLNRAPCSLADTKKAATQSNC